MRFSNTIKSIIQMTENILHAKQITIVILQDGSSMNSLNRCHSHPYDT